MVQGAQIICFSPKSTNLQTESNQILAQPTSSLPSAPLSPAPLLLLAPHCLNSHSCLSTELLFNADNPYLTSSLKLLCTKGPFPTTFCYREVFNSAQHAAESHGRSSKWQWKPRIPRGILPLCSLESSDASLLKLEEQRIMIKQQRTLLTNGICCKIPVCVWWGKRGNTKAAFIQEMLSEQLLQKASIYTNTLSSHILMVLSHLNNSSVNPVLQSKKTQQALWMCPGHIAGKWCWYNEKFLSQILVVVFCCCRCFL